MTLARMLRCLRLASLSTMRRFPVVGFILLAAGCQPLPQPFAHNGQIDNGLLDLPDHPGIVVLPVSDSPETTGIALAEAVAAALREANVPASTKGGNKLSAFLQGRVEDDGRNAQIVWELFDANGAFVGSSVQPIDGTPMDAWQAAEPALMADLGAGVSEKIAVMVQSDQPVERIGQRVAPPVVAGAPGDGDRSLATAMRQALASGGADVLAETPGLPSVSAEISLIPAGVGEEEVRINWVVEDATGFEVGVVAQSNVVPRGSLDGQWDGIAQAVAGAAAPAILELLERAEQVAGSQFTEQDPLAKPQRPD